MTSIVPPLSVRKGREIHAMLEVGRRAAEEAAQQATLIAQLEALGWSVDHVTARWCRASRGEIGIAGNNLVELLINARAANRRDRVATNSGGTA